MVELELLEPQADGEHLVLTDAEGRRYRVPVDEALRAAVRRSASGNGSGEGVQPLTPKEIQAALRAGEDVEDVADRSGHSPEHVRRFLGPVVAERDWVIQRAQDQRVGRDADAPRLGDLVLDRLATRDVDVESLGWTAVRRAGKPWEVIATFTAGDKQREARWSVDLSARSLHAVDDEARWLSETELSPAPQPRRHLNPVGASRRRRATEPQPEPEAVPEAEGPGEDAPEDASPETAGDATESLLAELAASRGTRVDLQPELEPVGEDGAELWGAHPPASRPDQARDAHVLALPRRQPAQQEGAEAAAGDEAPSASAGSGAEPAESGPARTRAGGTKPGSAEPRTAKPGTTEPAGEGPAAESGADSSARGAGKEPAPAARRSRKRDRRSVPSWDEIVFGARPD